MFSALRSRMRVVVTTLALAGLASAAIVGSSTAASSAAGAIPIGQTQTSGSPAVASV